jgi:hypothetical protein
VSPDPQQQLDVKTAQPAALLEIGRAITAARELEATPAP